MSLLALACLLLSCNCAQAALRMRAQTFSVPGLALADVRVDAALAANGRPQLNLDAARVSVPALGWHDVTLSLRGQPERVAGDSWKFTGHVTTRGAPGDALADSDLVVVYDPAGGSLEVDVTQAKTALHALLPLDQASHVQLKLAGLPLAWLRGLLAAAWPDGSVNAGSLAGDVAVDLGDSGTRISGRVNMQGAKLDSKAGNIAVENLAADGSFRIETGALASSLMFDGRLHGGNLLLGPLYAQLPTHAASLHLGTTFAATGIAVDTLDYDDHDALRLSGSMGFDRKGDLDQLDMQRFAATFPAAYSRYGTTLVPWLTGINGPDITGGLVGSFAFDGKGWQSLRMAAQNFALDSHGGGFAVAGLDGSVDWQARASRPATRLRWNALGAYRMAFGPAKLEVADRAGTLTLAAPIAVPVFGGTLQLNRLAWSPAAAATARLEAGFAVVGIDMAQLCKAFGWPAFGGTLGGAVPNLAYRKDALVFDGGLSLSVFDGSASITNLSLLHPFGAAPELAADIDMQQLDLAQLTSVFDFGAVSGRMDGYVHGLKLVGWQPTAFSAMLAANDGGKISQHAIRSLTSVGGGGVAGGLQGMALRVFKTFNYSRIGLSCTLADGVCAMGGVSPDPDPPDSGYTIVAGRGLPRITVIGHQRSVDWATLMSRLVAATKGEGPVIK